MQWLQTWASRTEVSSQRLFRIFWFHAVCWFLGRALMQWLFGVHIPLDLLAWAAFFMLIYYSIATSINTEFQIRGQKNISDIN